MEVSGLEFATWIAALRVQLPFPSSQTVSLRSLSGVSRVESTVIPSTKLLSRAEMVSL